VLTFLLSILLLEGGTAVVFRLIRHHWPPLSTVKAEIVRLSNSYPDFSSLILEERPPEYLWTDLVHPYLGYVFDPEKSPMNVSNYGFFAFPHKMDPIVPKSEGTVVVGLFGGSVAMETDRLAQDVLINAFKNSYPPFKSKKIILLSFALGGYKQPQQLMALNYMLALGGHFDIVINLDGFNEAALPLADNVPRKVNPFFPHDWYFRTAVFSHPRLLAHLESLILINQARVWWARIARKLAFYRSVTLTCLWRIGDQLLIQCWASGSSSMTDYKNLRSVSLMTTGPPFHYPDDIALLKDCAELWTRCSLQMYNLCRGNGIRYYHFLQPNQYDEGSKPMGEEERKVAIVPGHPYQKGIVIGYPYLRKCGKKLRAAGVPFYDLSRMFDHNTEELYNDSCCHLNDKGMRLIGLKIAETISQDLKRTDSPSG